MVLNGLNYRSKRYKTKIIIKIITKRALRLFHQTSFNILIYLFDCCNHISKPKNKKKYYVTTHLFENENTFRNKTKYFMQTTFVFFNAMITGSYDFFNTKHIYKTF